MASRDIYKFAVGLFQGSPGTVYAPYLTDIVNGASVDALYEAAAGWDAFTQQDFDFTSASTNTQFATQFVTNLTGSTLSAANFAFAVGLVEDLVESAMNAGDSQTAARGAAMKTAIDALDAVPESDANFGAAAARFHNQIDVATNATEVLNDSSVSLAALQDRLDQVTAEDASVAAVNNANMHAIHPGETFSYPTGATAGLDVMRLTGDQSVRIDFTNAAQQIRALDLDNDGVFDQDGIENQLWPTTAPGFEIIDAYRRDYTVEANIGENFLGDIHFDGTSYVGFDGDGVGTDGNIYLGGLGVDNAFGGVGNDFLAGGGVAVGRFVPQTGVVGPTIFLDTLTGLLVPGPSSDYLSGGRNADFFFAELSALDPTDGVGTTIDGGVTADNNSAGNTQSPQDTDWVLLEASDDDEPVHVVLNDHLNVAGGLSFTGGRGSVTTRSGAAVATLIDVENVDASGNFYGFLNNVDTVLGGRGILEEQGFIAPRGAGPNIGIGSSAQLDIDGSLAANRLIGGYDNDVIRGWDGNDLLMGGNLNFRTTNPGQASIVNDGRDELFGLANNDDIVFEVDGGVIDGGADNDTLWVTANSLGTRTTAQLMTDGRLRIDLLAQNLDASSGYGGADSGDHDLVADDTQDQTNWITSGNRVALSNMENVIATGLGNIDYDPDGTNTGELNHTTQMNFAAYGDNNLDLRGDAAANRLYASAGDDVIEGRGGKDSLSGGLGDDDFIFGAGLGDGVDVIHRQADATGDGFWDGYNVNTGSGGTFQRDFNDISAPILSNSKLTLTLFDTANPAAQLTGFPVNGIVFTLGGVNFTVTAGHSDTYAGFTALLNTALDANVALAGLNAALNADTTITITDPAGGTFVAGGFTWVDNITPPSGTLHWDMVIGDPAVAQTRDRLIYQGYEDRADGEKIDDNSVTGSTISLGVDSYAQDLVINFAAADYDTSGDGVADTDTQGTNIAEDQVWQLNFANLTTEDRVKITVNGVIYELQVGVDLDGNSIAAEDGLGDTQGGIQHFFLIRLRDFINSFMDDDTSVGALVAAASDSDVLAPDDPAFGAGNDRITLTQKAYAGEETVYMRSPIVDITDNSSGGQVAARSVVNASQHDVQLLDFDGRNGELNANNVLFLGNTGASRSILATAPNVGGTTLPGSEAVLIDGGLNDLFDDPVPAGTVASFNNTATNATLALNFSVHGDDLLIGGNGIDTINAGTGDDRVHGSLGNDVIDGGENYYAVQVLGEPRARVYVLNAWEAANPTAAGSVLAGLTISSITLINQTQSGNGTQSGLFDDTLLFQQQDFLANTNFTISLLPGTTVANVVSGVLQMPQGGAGTVAVDNGGDGTTDSTTTFTNFENIRTVSGTGHAVAGDGQGNDTLNVTALSGALGGVLVDITNAATAGNVMYSTNAHASAAKPAEADFETLIIKVDGIENVIAGTGDDLVIVDETEAAKNNTFTLGLGDDRVIYRNDYNTLAVADLNGDGLINAADDPIAEDFSEPTVTIRVDDGRALGAATPVFTPFTHQVVMTSGRVGATVATDMLVGTGVALGGSEWISLESNTAQGRLENDVIDVTAMAGGAVVDYVLGQVRDLGGVIQVRIDGMFEMENVWGDGNDTVIVGDASLMGLNARSDIVPFVGTAPDLALATWLDFDQLNGVVRVPFLNQTSLQIENALNQNQFTFDLSRVGVDVDSDTVDYSNANDQISLRVELDPAQPNQYVLVDADGVAGPMNIADSTPAGGAAGVGAAVGDRVDRLISVEKVVASQGESILDLTASTKGLEVNFQAFDLANRVAALDRDVFNVQISDLASSVPLTRSYVEFRDAGTSGTVIQPTATWSRIEGSDFAERVILSSAHSTDNNTFNLRGGANEVKYNELTRSITTTLMVSDFDAASPLTADASGFVGPFYPSTNPAATTIQRGTVMAVTQFQDGTSPPLPGAPVPLAGGGTHVATSYTANNTIAGGSLRIAASQDAEDTLAVSGLTDKLFLLSEVGTTDNQITVKIGSGAAQNSIILTGYERLQDAASNDLYQMGSLAVTLAGLALIDSPADHDTIKVGNDAVGFNASGAGTIDLDNISATVGGFNMDFDGLDVTAVTVSGLILRGGTDAAPVEADANEAADNTDELVVGALSQVTTISDFESIVITAATTAGGSVFVLDTTANTLTQGATIVNVDGFLRTVSAGGLVFEGELGNSYLLNVATPVTLTALGAGAVSLYGGDGNDTLTGATGNDTVSGGAGNDTLAGGGPQLNNIYTVDLGGLSTAAAETVTVFGQTYVTLAAGEGPDTVGAFFDAIAANLFTDGSGNNPINVTYDNIGNQVILTFASDVSATVDGTDVAFSNAAGLTAAAPAEVQAFAALAAGDDLFRGGQGVDNMSGGAGDDQFVVVGALAAADVANYTGAGPAIVPVAIRPVLNYSELLAVNASSEAAAGEIYDGGVGLDTTHVYGTASFVGSTLTGLDIMVIYSNVTLTISQLNALTVLQFDGNTPHMITIVNDDGSPRTDAQQVADLQAAPAFIITTNTGPLTTFQVGGNAVQTLAQFQGTYGGAIVTPNQVFTQAILEALTPDQIAALDVAGVVNFDIEPEDTATLNLAQALAIVAAGWGPSDGADLVAVVDVAINTQTKVNTLQAAAFVDAIDITVGGAVTLDQASALAADKLGTNGIVTVMDVTIDTQAEVNALQALARVDVIDITAGGAVTLDLASFLGATKLNNNGTVTVADLGATLAANILGGANLDTDPKADILDATDDAVTLNLAQELAADAKLVLGDVITVLDTNVVIQGAIAALAANLKVDIIDASNDILTLNVAEELAADAKLVVPDFITVFDTAANITAGAAALAASIKVDAIDASDNGVIIVDVATELAIDGRLVDPNDIVLVFDLGANIAANALALGANNTDLIDASDNLIIVNVAGELAIDAKLADLFNDLIVVFDTGANIAAAILALVASHTDFIDASDDAITLTVAEEAAADSKLVLGDVITVLDTNVAIEAAIAVLAPNIRVDVIDASNDILTLGVVDALTAEAKLVVGDLITVADAGGTIAAVIALLAASTKVDIIDATDDLIGMNVANELAADSKLVAGDTIIVVDTGANIAAGIASLAINKTDLIDATDDAITMNVANELLANAKLVGPGDVITVFDTGANIAANIATLSQFANATDIFNASNNAVTLTGAEYNGVDALGKVFDASDALTVLSDPGPGPEILDFNGAGGGAITLLMDSAADALDVITNFTGASDVIRTTFLGIGAIVYEELANDTADTQDNANANVIVIADAINITSAALWIAGGATTQTNGLIVIDTNDGNTAIFSTDNLAGDGTETLLVVLAGIVDPAAALSAANFSI